MNSINSKNTNIKSFYFSLNHFFWSNQKDYPKTQNKMAYFGNDFYHIYLKIPD